MTVIIYISTDIIYQMIRCNLLLILTVLNLPGKAGKSQVGVQFPGDQRLNPLDYGAAAQDSATRWQQSDATHL